MAGRRTGRLQNATGPWGADVYSHDGVGNLTNFDRTVSGVTSSRVLAYGAANNRLTSVLLGGVTERAFTHDAAGNITGDNRGAGGNFAYVINRTGRIAQAQVGGQVRGDYVYDAFERLRVRTLSNQPVAANNGVTHYVWDIFGNIIAEADGATGAALRETLYLEGMPIAAVNAAAASPKPIFHIHTDHLHRPIMMTDAGRANVWWASYEPYGRVQATGGTLTQNLQLPGQWFQLETGLAYNWHRHYDPTLGRYTTPDPLGFVDGPSVFAYANGGPQRWTDPTGLFAPVVIAAGAAAAYIFTPSIANAPGPADDIIPNNDISPFANAGIAAACLSPHYWFSARSHGGGIRAWRDGPGVDWHRFKHNGQWVNRPHYHRGSNSSQMSKHRPWQGGW